MSDMLANERIQSDEELTEALLGEEGRGTKTTETAEFPDEMTILQCFWKITKISVPIILVGLAVQVGVTVINTFFIGNLNDANLLGGVGMGNMLINVGCFAVVFGLNGALETLVSQSFGAEKYEECGVFLNRGKLISTLILIPIFVIFGASERLLIIAGQDPIIAEIARRYSCILIPGIWAQAMFDATTRFLNAQFEIMITLYVQIATLIVHIFLCFFFIKVLDGREIGAAMATNVTYILNLVSLELYCYCSPNLK